MIYTSCGNYPFGTTTCAMCEAFSKPLSVLLIEDRSDDAARIQTALARCRDMQVVVHTVASRKAALDHLRQSSSDVVLADLRLPDAAGGEVLTELHLAAPRTPVIILSTSQADELLQQIPDGGNQDYVRKDSVTPEALRIAIGSALKRQRLTEELRVASELLAKMNRNLRRSYETAQQFVDNVSHEFRTPLTVIKEFTWLVREEVAGPITEQQARYLDTVLNRTEDLALMVDDMLDVSKLKAGLLSVDRRSHELQPIVEQVVTIIERRASAKRLEVVTRFAERLPKVFCDEEKVRRVILNLAVNAIKFTPDSGRVSIRAEEEPGGRFVRVSISDTGTGISKQDQERIFRRFHQVERQAAGNCKGFGLGLDIARELVGLNLGSIDCRSEPGRGSTFSFTLPIDAPDVLADVFLARAMADRDASAITLLEATTIAIQDKRSLDVQEFLSEHLCGDDLLYPCSPTRWLILCTRNEQQVDELSAAVSAARSEFNRNSPTGQLPPICISPLDCGQLPGDFQRFRSAFCPAGGSQPLQMNGIAPRQVLIVDDDYEVAEALSVRLAGAGYRVLTARNGQEGIESAVLHGPDAVLMDIRMPVKDGMTALSEMRTHPDTRHLPIIMLSASVRDQQTALDYGARFFIQKPYDARTVLSALEASMEGTA